MVSVSLSDYIRRVRRDRKLTISDVVRRSKGAISASYINKLENSGEFADLRVSLAKLQALALGLGVTESELIAIANHREPDAGELFHEKLIEIDKALAGEASPETRAYIDRLLDLIVSELKPTPVAKL